MFMGLQLGLGRERTNRGGKDLLGGGGGGGGVSGFYYIKREKMQKATKRTFADITT